MKKILSVILVLVMGITLLPFAALAKETETFTLSVSGKTEGYKAGDIITVTITASNPNILYGLMATPEYDSTAFDMAVENGDVFSDLSTGKNLIFVELNSTPGTTVATLKFTVKEGAAQKDYSFGLKNVTASDESESPVSCTIVEATARVGTQQSEEETTETLTLSVSGKTEGYKAGDVITVTISASDPSKLYGLMITPAYDSTAFDMAVENGDVFSDLSTGKNLIFVELNSTPGTTVATLKFTAKENAAVKEYTFGLKNVTASDESENPVSCIVTEATACVGIYGDVSGDGECKINDIIQLIKYLVGDKDAAKYPDVNGDSVCNLLDAVCLLKYLMSKN